MPRRTSKIAENIGPTLVEARRIGTPWKVLQRQTGLGPTRLYQLHKAELAKRQADDKNIHECFGAGLDDTR